MPPEIMLRSFGLGVLYGVGGLTFGLGIRYIGFSLNYVIAIGISAVLGTVLPLVWTPNEGFVHRLGTLVDSREGLIVTLGIGLAVIGMFLCGYAGALRERSGGGRQPFDFRLGVPLAVLAGILSSVFNFSLIAGEPLAEAAVKQGAVELLSGNAIYPFSHGGAWVTNVAWCIVLMRKNRTSGQLIRLPGERPDSLGFYYLMAAASGAFWYFQFFFYGMGHLNLGEKFGFTSWAIHMALLILFSNIYGKLFREWEGASKWPRRIVHYGMIVIVAGTLVITYGNYEAEQAPAPEVDVPVETMPPARPSPVPEDVSAPSPPAPGEAP